MSSNTNIHQKLGQAGMASILVSMIMMIVITLIVIGFATVVRRNSRESLDHQLSAQAYYAAETGVNQAASWLESHSSEDLENLTNSSTFSTDCNAFMSAIGANNVLSSSDNVAYTCLLVSDKVPSIVKNLSLGEQASFPISLSRNAKLLFSWQLEGNVTSTARADASNCPAKFTPVSNWKSVCPYGMLRVDIYDGTGTNAAAMASNTATLYLMPGNTSSGPFVQPNAGKPLIYRAKCDSATKTCTATVKALRTGNFNSGRNYYVRISNIYENSGNVIISNDNKATFSGAEYLVDATGKAQDELQRIQVHLPANNGSPFSANDAVASGGAVCKRFTVQGAGSSATPSNLCQP